MTIGECRIIQVLLGIRTSNDPQGLKKTHLVFLCDTAWPQYPLEDSEQWPVGGSLKYNTVLQLDRFCKEQGKWVEVTWHPTLVLLPGKSHGWRSLGSPMGSLRVRHDWVTSLSIFTFMYWRRKWQPTPVFLPRESQGQGSLVGFHLWGHTESDTTEVT